MDRTQLLLASLLAIVSSVVCEATPRAGKCHQICMDPYPLDFTGVYTMHSVHILPVIVASLISNIECGFGIIPIAGKCQTFNITPTPMDLAGLAGLWAWEVVYSTETYLHGDVDHEFRFLTPITDGVFRVDDVRTFKDNSTNRYTFIATIFDDYVTHEDAVDRNGIRHLFRIYILALSVDRALLYYRCSDVGDPDIDTRFIEIPKGKTLSKAGLKYLKEIEKEYNFRGAMSPLPRALINSS